MVHDLFSTLIKSIGRSIRSLDVCSPLEDPCEWEHTFNIYNVLINLVGNPIDLYKDWEAFADRGGRE